MKRTDFLNFKATDLAEARGIINGDLVEFGVTLTVDVVVIAGPVAVTRLCTGPCGQQAQAEPQAAENSTVQQ